MLRRHLPFVTLLVLGLMLRIALMYFYFPGLLLSFDSPRYARAGGMPLFGDFWMPAGYPVFLLALRALSSQLWITIAVQHGLGLATGFLLYLSARKLDLGRWLSCLPASVALLSGDQLYLEHSIMADFFLTFGASAGLYAAVVWIRHPQRVRWLLIASACLGVTTLIRSVGIVLLPVLALTVLLDDHGLWRDKVRLVSLAVSPGALVFLAYFTACKLTGGEYLGFADMRGWNLYSRVAPFADCRSFRPPNGTAVLCEERKPDDRPGPLAYVWDAQSVSRRNFELTPQAGQHLLAFADAAILHQPGAYLKAVGIDLARYLFPSISNRPYAGQPREILTFGWRDLEVERMVTRAMAWKYAGVKVIVRKPGWLATYQSIIRTHGIVLVAFILLTIVSACCKGAQRRAIALFGLSALGLYLLPVATISYDFRYGIPPESLLAMSGALGLAACLPRRVSS